MATTRERDVVISPYFGLPALVTDVRYPPVEDSTTFDEIVVAEAAAVEDDPEDSPIPTPPSTFIIEEQKVRISTDGTAVVDMTIELPDVDDVYQVDVRVTKV